ncbi:hypothetical protein [Afipia sp. DC4300-2b1]|uniref:hypothetical protein n=1 Tax=Afipia sp. DC4300-2b1 TaxID=2804672 RepID=UPI003CF5F235
MTIQQTPSSYGVSKAFLDALDNLAQKPSWWRDVLLRDDVFIAVRANSLNVYHRGASIFRIDDGGDGRLIPWTHTKYLIRQQQVLAQLHHDGHFQPADIGWSQYAGPSTLSDMIRSATDLAGAEKSGLHPLIVGSSKVIDVELSLLRANSSIDESLADTDAHSAGAPPIDRSQDRLDVVTVENRGGKPFIVFHEAKHFSNPALRAKGEPAVLAQIVRYQATLRQHDATLRQRYVAVCQALVRLHTMQTAARTALPSSRPPLEPDPLIAAIASGQVKAEIDPDPRLIVFGFDGDQRDGRWERDAKRLREHQPALKIKAIGSTRSAHEFF